MPEHADGSIEVYATPAEVMAVISDFEHYPEWAAQLVEAKVLARDAKGRPKRVAFRVEAPMMTATYTLDYTYAPRAAGISWTYVEGSLNDLSGSYTLEPTDQDTTRVNYSLDLDISAPLPGLVKRQAAKQIVRTALSDLKRRVEEG